AVAAEVNRLVAESGRVETTPHLVFEGRARMIGREGDAHRAAQLWPGSVEGVRPVPESSLELPPACVGCPPRGAGRWPGSRVGCGPRTDPSRTPFVTPTTRSTVNPNFSKIVPAGADAPKWSRPTIAPLSPTQRSQPSDTPASTATRAATAEG